MKMVYEAGNIIDAHLVRHALEHAGIPAFVRGEALLGGMGEFLCAAWWPCACRRASGRMHAASCARCQSWPIRMWAKENIVARINEVVDEVWFTGAHADVGGGYREGRHKGTSMNWMLAALKEKGLVGQQEHQLAHYVDFVNDPAQFLKGMLYRERWRDLRRYARESAYNGGRLKVHPSVFWRMETLPTSVDIPRPGDRGSPRGLQKEFSECFIGDKANRYVFLPREGCLLTRL